MISPVGSIYRTLIHVITCIINPNSNPVEKLLLTSIGFYSLNKDTQIVSVTRRGFVLSDWLLKEGRMELLAQMDFGSMRYPSYQYNYYY